MPTVFHSNRDCSGSGDNDRRMKTDRDPSQQPLPEEVWRGILMGTDPRFRKSRALYKHFPREPRCKMCGVPFAGPIAPIMRMRAKKKKDQYHG